MNNWNLLWVFYKVVEAGNISSGGETLHLSQSAVSHSLKNLEEEYQTKLAERSRRGFALTDAGKKLFKFCQRMFSEHEILAQNLGSFQKTPQGSLIIGTSLTMGTGYFLKHCPKLKKLYPQLTIHLHLEPSTSFLVPLLEEGKIDIACINEDYLPRINKPHIFPLHLDTRVVLYGASAYLKKFKKVKKKEDIFQFTFVDLNLNRSSEKWFLSRTGLQGQFQNYLYTNIVSKEAVLQGLGISICPRFYIEKELKEKKVELILPKMLTIERKDYLCCLDRKKELLNIRTIFEYFQKAL